MYATKIEGYKSYLIRTHIIGAQQFWPAETHHQRYLETQPTGYCNHRVRFEWDELFEEQK